MDKIIILLGTFFLIAHTSAQAAQCPDKDIHLQVLGSGNSSLTPDRAAPGYIIWQQGRARLLINIGSGTAVQFKKAGGKFTDLDAIFLTQVDSTHTADMTAFMSAAIHEERKRPLPVFGPGASKTTPSTVSFIRSLFDDKRGAFRDLGPLISPLGSKTFKLQPHNQPVKYKKPDNSKNLNKKSRPVFSNTHFNIYNINVAEKKSAKLGWLISYSHKKIYVIGDAHPDLNNLQNVVKDNDLLVVHHAIPETGPDSNKTKFLSPSAIGTLAYKSKSKQLVLGHRRAVTLGKEKETIAAIKSKYAGLVQFANDLDCFKP